MVAFTRRQRAYDHRLREWVHRSGQDPRDVGITVPRSTAEAPALRVVFRTNAGKEILGGIRRRSVVPLCTPINLTRRREAAKGKPWIQVVGRLS